MALMRKAPGRPLRNARSATGRFAAYAPSSGFPFLEEMRNRAFPIGRPVCLPHIDTAAVWFLTANIS